MENEIAKYIGLANVFVFIFRLFNMSFKIWKQLLLFALDRPIDKVFLFKECSRSNKEVKLFHNISKKDEFFS